MQSIKKPTLNNSSKIESKIVNPIVVPTSPIVKQNLKSTNDTFFDKFDKTKKEHKSTIKKLKKEKYNGKSNSGIMTSFGKKLQSTGFLVKIYSLIAGVASLTIILGILLFVLLIDFFNGTPAILPTNIPIATGLYQFIRDIQYTVKLSIYQPIVQTIVILSMASVAIIFTPILYIVSSWFIGMNNIHKERKFVIAYASIIGISIFLLLVSIILLFALAWGPFGPFVYPFQPAS